MYWGLVWLIPASHISPVCCSDMTASITFLLRPAGPKSMWTCCRVGFYRDLPVAAINFSPDGSLLAVSFESILTLWDPASCQLMGTLSQPYLNEKILWVAEYVFIIIILYCTVLYCLVHQVERFTHTHKNTKYQLMILYLSTCVWNHIGSLHRQVEFSRGEGCRSLVVNRSKKWLYVWDLLTCSLSWRVSVQSSYLAADPLSPYMAIFSEDCNCEFMQQTIFPDADHYC